MMKEPLRGRAVAILIGDGSDGAVIDKIKKAETYGGARVLDREKRTNIIREYPLEIVDLSRNPRAGIIAPCPPS